MKIEGIKEISDGKIAEAILKFIYIYLPNEEEINIEEGDEEYLYIINDKKYIFINTYEAYGIINEYNKEMFETSVYESISNPKYWLGYIDCDKWIDDNGVQDFSEYWESMNEEHLIEVDNYNNIEIYECC